ncbi:hypothetical protein [Bifidobacterium xylocopae]|uniref:Uncharacterized protein n=1 Tax=Bifidobacterium xylocopae TaxID=2493119 RepID=A0A366KEC2_9BIFI|nr:hypothetical protein [Bifidobacterium xylocopae]RBQ00067.1 hypothetical protein CRD59_00980 [Bifidobacterium xylocopae]
MDPIQWPQHLRLVNQWLADRTGMKPYTRVPDKPAAMLPLIHTGLAPSGSLGRVERSVSVDIDVLADGWKSMNPLIQQVDSAMAALAGNGNQYGYVDDLAGTAFADVPWGDPSILRCTATFTLTMRPISQ